MSIRTHAAPLLLVASLLVAGCNLDPATPIPAEDPAGAPPEAAAILGDDHFSPSHRIPDFPDDPGDFVAEITNPYLAFARGKVFRYEGNTEEGLESELVEVTHDTETILGVATTVVHAQAFLDGRLVEDTFDWLAQDEDGNVWYFGEDTREIAPDGSVVSTEGSWRAGVDGARPGILMLARPRVGATYDQERAEGVAEDRAKVVSLDAEVEVPYGEFEDCLKTREWTPLEPGIREFKYYERGVGLLLERQPDGDVRLELVDVQG